MALKYVTEGNFNNKNVIARFDFNVPLSKDGSGKITDTTRIDSALPTIKYILEQNPKKLIMMSHLGRPDGEVKMKYSLAPVAKYLAEVLNQDVLLTESCTDRGIKTIIKLNKQKLILLENLRFHIEETDGNDEFAKTLSEYGDIFVHDAFGTAHRKHASTYQIIKYFPNNSFGGFLLQKEVEALNKIVDKPAQPFIGIMGGAKVGDKIKIIEKLLVSVDKLLIGGAMAYPFLKASGHSVGKSLCDEEDVKLAKQILTSTLKQKLVFPIDHLCSESPEGAATHINQLDIPEDKMGLDIGPNTINKYNEILKSAKTILWNGPMGYFEKENFNKGTFAIAESISKLKAFTLVGGGDSVSAINKSGVSDKISHVSTGGGASLEFIENGTLPGIQALKFGVN